MRKIEMKKLLTDLITLLIEHAVETNNDLYFIKIKKSTLDKFLDKININSNKKKYD